MTHVAPPRWLALVAAAVATAIVCITFGAHWAALPDIMASHWGLRGTPDGAAPKTLLVALFTVPTWVIGIITTTVPSPHARARLITLSAGLCGLFSAIAWSVVTLNRDAPDWKHANDIPVFHLGVLALATLAPASAALIAFRSVLRVPDVTTETPSLTLTGSERAVWMGSARNPWLFALLLLPAPILWSKHAATPWMSVVSALVAGMTLILADAFSLVRVKADGSGVAIRCGRLGWINRRVALADVERAEVLDLVPLAHGGWGYRGSLRWFKRAAIVVRGGSALKLSTRDGKQLTVTVDDAESGASLINAMVRRQ